MTIAQLAALGLIADEQGKIIGIDLPISNIPQLKAGFSRRIRLSKFVIEEDMEMAVTYETYITDATGKDAYREVGKDMALSEWAKRNQLSMLQPLQTQKTTRNSFRSSTTGAMVDDGGAPGAIPELLYFQNLARAQLTSAGMVLTGNEPYILVVYMMIASIAKEIDARGEF